MKYIDVTRLLRTDVASHDKDGGLNHHARHGCRQSDTAPTIVIGVRKVPEKDRTPWRRDDRRHGAEALLATDQKMSLSASWKYD